MNKNFSYLKGDGYISYGHRRGRYHWSRIIRDETGTWYDYGNGLISQLADWKWKRAKYTCYLEYKPNRDHSWMGKSPKGLNDCWAIDLRSTLNKD